MFVCTSTTATEEWYALQFGATFTSGTFDLGLYFIGNVCSLLSPKVKVAPCAPVINTVSLCLSTQLFVLCVMEKLDIYEYLGQKGYLVL